MKIKVFILVALVLCLTLSIGSAFAEFTPFFDFSNYDFVVYGYSYANQYIMQSQSASANNRSIGIGSIEQIIDLNADIYVGTVNLTMSEAGQTISISYNLSATFIEQASDEYLLTLDNGLYIYIDTETERTYIFGVFTWIDNFPSTISLSPLLVGYEKAVPIQSGLFVDAYNWFNNTFFSGDVPPLLETLSEEFSTIFAVLFVGCIVVIPLFLVWVLVKSVIAMSLFNR